MSPPRVRDARSLVIAALCVAGCSAAPPPDVAGDDTDSAVVVDTAVDDIPVGDASPLIDASTMDAAVVDVVAATADASVDTSVNDAVDAPVDVTPPGYGGLGLTAREGETVTLRTHPTVNYRGVDAAYDPVNRVFLVVYGNAPIGGAFLDDEGRQIGDGFRLTDDPYNGGNWTQLPRVAFGGGDFVVTWHLEVGRGVTPQARRVRYSSAGPVFPGASVALSDQGSMQESPASVAYSPETGEFLAVWAQNGVRARRLGPDGAVRGSVIAVSDDGVFAEQPSVVWSPAAGAFFVAYMQVVGNGARVGLRRVEGGTGRLLGDARDLTGLLSFAKVTDVAWDDAGRAVIASWYEVRGGRRGFSAQRIGPDGNPLGATAQVFDPHGSYDGYDLAWSAATGTSLSAFHGDSVEDVGAELDRSLMSSTPFQVTAAGARNGTFLPRVVAHPTRPFWLVIGSADYARVVAQRIAWTPRPRDP